MVCRYERLHSTGFQSATRHTLRQTSDASPSRHVLLSLLRTQHCERACRAPWMMSHLAGLLR